MIVAVKYLHLLPLVRLSVVTLVVLELKERFT